MSVSPRIRVHRGSSNFSALEQIQLIGCIRATKGANVNLVCFSLPSTNEAIHEERGKPQDKTLLNATLYTRTGVSRLVLSLPAFCRCVNIALVTFGRILVVSRLCRMLVFSVVESEHHGGSWRVQLDKAAKLRHLSVNEPVTLSCKRCCSGDERLRTQQGLIRLCKKR